MPYRTFSRALGATSLEIKCIFLFAVFLLVVMTVNFLLYWRVTEEVVYAQNPHTARLLAGQAMVIKHWEDLERDREFLPALENLVDKLGREKYEHRFIFRPDERRYLFNFAGEHNVPKGSSPPRNQFERDLMQRLMQPLPLENTEEENEKEKEEVQDWDELLTRDGAYYKYYQPIRTSASCVSSCHQAYFISNDLAGIGTGLSLDGTLSPPPEGELMLVVEVTIPNAMKQQAVRHYWGLLLGVAIITAFLALIAFYVVIRYVIVRPLRHLRDVSDAISHGDILLRADIHTGDEFESLGMAFNRMLRHLVDVHEELRRANVSLDGKVDELAQMNMQLYEMNRIKSDFLATMSHELRTPLNSILGFSEVLGSIDSLDGKQQRYVENIRASGRMLLDMINDVLDLAKIESGKMDVRLSEFGIERVIGAQCDMARPLSEKKNIDIKARIEPGLPPLSQDQARVQQILNNLLSNAIKFTPEGGRITVAARRDGDDLVLEVIDTGVGIAEEDQQTIFEKFRQGKSVLPGGDAMTREYSGTGLGLSIVRELCALLGGDVSVQSELGTGSTFAVRLPWELAEPPPLDFPLAIGLEQSGRAQLDLKSPSHTGHVSADASGDGTVSAESP